MEAFLVEFKMYMTAGDQAAAMAQIRVWRALAAAAGFEPGGGQVRAVSEAELARYPQLLSTLKRARDGEAASDHARRRAVEALASHMGGDLTGAGGLVEAIERELGFLPAEVAKALERSRRKVAA